MTSLIVLVPSQSEPRLSDCTQGNFILVHQRGEGGRIDRRRCRFVPIMGMSASLKPTATRTAAADRRKTRRDAHLESGGIETLKQALDLEVYYVLSEPPPAGPVGSETYRLDF